VKIKKAIVTFVSNITLFTGAVYTTYNKYTHKLIKGVIAAAILLFIASTFYNMLSGTRFFYRMKQEFRQRSLRDKKNTSALNELYEHYLEEKEAYSQIGTEIPLIQGFNY
jgi:hypothetical protein